MHGVDQSVFDALYAASQQSRQTIRQKECDKNAIGLVSISNFCLTLPSCDVLRSFYLKRICASRTLLEHNLYLDMFQASQKSKPLEAALFSLSSLYLGANDSGIYRQGALAFLRNELNHPDDRQVREYPGTSLLLLQYSILSEQYCLEWYAHAVSVGPLLEYARSFPDTLGYRMKIASHSILANATTIEGEQLQALLFLSEQEKEIQRVDALCGLSPELLSIIQEINCLAARRDQDTDAFRLLASLQQLRQTCFDKDIAQEFQTQPARLERAKGDAAKTAESYRLSAILYLHYRILGAPATDEALKPIQEQLLAILEQLPSRGPYYKMAPLAPLHLFSAGTLRGGGICNHESVG
ncbi:hypothetical protein P154DRAFT_568669 [Amniculicola lignicola CBS 123094]|uniref:Uncharacterized protein n=1 Tax=Amniculicola lignicola CBS 123094 TaxID=1392246 RepID=A0A6A5X4H6_9PLEO|nr:hypothetical protein P154DRAFT_568669 [Amniculicola lignicola CBS 123094]